MWHKVAYYMAKARFLHVGLLSLTKFLNNAKINLNLLWKLASLVNSCWFWALNKSFVRLKNFPRLRSLPYNKYPLSFIASSNNTIWILVPKMSKFIDFERRDFVPRRDCGVRDFKIRLSFSNDFMVWKVIILQVNPPQVNLPQVNLPQVNLPQVNSPKCKLPKCKLPKCNLPAGQSSCRSIFPQVNPPQIKLPKWNLPKFKTLKCNPPWAFFSSPSFPWVVFSSLSELSVVSWDVA